MSENLSHNTETKTNAPHAAKPYVPVSYTAPVDAQAKMQLEDTISGIDDVYEADESIGDINIQPYLNKGLTKKFIEQWVSPPSTNASYSDYWEGIANKFDRVTRRGTTKLASFPYEDLDSDNLFSGYIEGNDILGEEAPPFIANLDDMEVGVRNRGEQLSHPSSRILGGFLVGKDKENDFALAKEYSTKDVVAGVDVMGKFRIGVLSDVLAEMAKELGVAKLSKKDALLKVVKLNPSAPLKTIESPRYVIRVKDEEGNLYTLNNQPSGVGKVLITDANMKHPQLIYGGRKFIVSAMNAYKEKFGNPMYFMMDNGNYAKHVYNEDGLENKDLRRFDGRNTAGGHFMYLVN